MGGGGNSGTSSTSSGPWEGQQPYLADIFSKAASLYNNMSSYPNQGYYMGNMVQGFTDPQQQAMSSIYNLGMQGSPQMAQANQAISGQLGTQSPQQPIGGPGGQINPISQPAARPSAPPPAAQTTGATGYQPPPGGSPMGKGATAWSPQSPTNPNGTINWNQTPQGVTPSGGPTAPIPMTPGNPSPYAIQQQQAAQQAAQQPVAQQSAALNMWGQPQQPNTDYYGNQLQPGAGASVLGGATPGWQQIVDNQQKNLSMAG